VSRSGSCGGHEAKKELLTSGIVDYPLETKHSIPRKYIIGIGIVLGKSRYARNNGIGGAIIKKRQFKKPKNW